MKWFLEPILHFSNHSVEMRNLPL